MSASERLFGWNKEHSFRKDLLPEEVLREDVRLRMLNAMCEDAPRLMVDDCEFHRTEKGYTYESMETIQEKYPEADCIFWPAATRCP